MKIKKISIVIPVYNEEANIDLMVDSINQAISKINYQFEIIFINDGSKDKTLNFLEKNAQKYPDVKIVSFARNYGQTAALSAGINYSSGDIIVPMDGDMQNDPSDISRLIDKINSGFDVVSGWRKNRQDLFISRKIPSFIANKIISKVTGVRLHDYGCSIKAYRSSLIKNIRLYGELHRFVPILAHMLGAKITEIEVKHHERKFGNTKYGINRAFKVILDLFVLKFILGYETKPIYFFGGFAFITFGIGLFMILSSIILKIQFDISFTETPLLLSSMFLFLFGFISLMMGLIADIVMRTYYETQSKDVFRISKLINIKEKKEKI